MDTLSLAVTGLSLVLVVVMGIIVGHLLREERRRSEARVAALLSMSAQGGDGRDGPRIAPAVRHDDSDHLELRPSHPEDVAPMFAQPEQSAAWSRRMAIIVPLALIVTGAGFAFYPSRTEIGAPTPPVAAPPERTPAAMPLELLSLRHTQQADRLVVTGLVQNPRSGSAVSKVFATAFLFGADGTLLASGRAPLDFTTLAPGHESPFVVTVPVKGAVSRYRIGFRGEDGRVIAHVDRRAGGTLARVAEERR